MSEISTFVESAQTHELVVVIPCAMLDGSWDTHTLKDNVAEWINDLIYRAEIDRTKFSADPFVLADDVIVYAGAKEFHDQIEGTFCGRL